MVLTIGFVLTLLMMILQSAVFPSLGLLAFSPFIALCCMRCRFVPALWLTAFSGLCNDLISSEIMGLHALSATISCAVLYGMRSAIFKDFTLQLCFSTALACILIRTAEISLLFLLDSQLTILVKYLVFDFTIMPLINAFYAFIWLAGPLVAWVWGSTRWKTWRRKENERE
jgi:hypothetical protein